MSLSITAGDLIERLTVVIGRLTVELEKKDAALEQAHQIIADMEVALKAKIVESDDF